MTDSGKALEPPWPPPPNVRAVLAAARRRYRAASVFERPALGCPSSVIGLFPHDELLALAVAGFWPLGARALAWLGRRRRPSSRVRRAVADMLSEHLPDAVEALVSQAIKKKVSRR